ncbi:MAG TPA: HNH endonuclease, partial [Candidatus Paceibacterota bacterium]
GANRGDNYIDEILVVYVAKKQNSNDREIIAFCLNARVFRTGQSGEELCRNFRDDGNEKIASYSIQSNNLCDLRERLNKFEIRIKEYNTYMFRMQRVYDRTYPELDTKIITYIESIIGNKDTLDNDNNEEQEEIQNAEVASLVDIKNSGNKPLTIVDSTHGKIISKDSRISKSALIDANYKCVVDPNHTTFLTKHHVPYMEGHHLIPCTVSNSQNFMERFNKNIDCFENIVCLCPSCHRELHYGELGPKSEKIKLIYKKYQLKLDEAGLLITEEELLELYQ